MAPVSRREFLGYTAALPFLLQFHELAAAQRKRVKIRDVQVMMLAGRPHLHARQDHRRRRAVRHRGGVRQSRRRREGADPVAEAVAGRARIRSRSTRSTRRWARAPRNLSGTRTDGSAHNLLRAVSGIEMALWDLAGKILDVPTSTLLGGKFRDRVRVYDHAAPRNMLDKASCREWAAQGQGAPERLHRATSSASRTPSPADRSRARSLESHAHHQGADQHPARASRTAARRSAGTTTSWSTATGNTICARRFRSPTRSNRSSRSGSRIRCRSTTPTRGGGCARARRCPSAWARIWRAAKGSRISSSTRGRHSASRSAQLGRIPRNQAHRRPGGHLRPADGDPQHRQPGAHVRDVPVGGVDPRLHVVRNGHRAKADGWIRCCCSTVRTSRTASSQVTNKPDWESR